MMGDGRLLLPGDGASNPKLRIRPPTPVLYPTQAHAVPVNISGGP